MLRADAHASMLSTVDRATLDQIIKDSLVIILKCKIERQSVVVQEAICVLKNSLRIQDRRACPGGRNTNGK